MSLFWSLVHLIIFPGGAFALLVALYLKGLDRRLVARLQSRVGPPLNQPFLDIAKLLTKEQLIPATACRPVFLLAPVIGMAGMAACAALVWARNRAPLYLNTSSSARSTAMPAPSTILDMGVPRNFSSARPRAQLNPALNSKSSTYRGLPQA